MNKKKVAIIGIGALGEGMVDVFSKHPSVELVAVCDTNVEKVEQCISSYQVKGYTNHTEMLETEKIDLVYVAVPPKWHHIIASEVIRAGIHILCEKPLANSEEEALELLQLANKAKIVHAMNFPLSYLNSTREFEKLVKEGYLGRLRKLELTLKFPKWPRDWQQNNWINTREQGGFVFEVTGHFIQLIQRFFGPISAITSELEFPENPELPETGIMARMSLSTGVPISYNGLSGIAGDEEQYFNLTAYGTDGTLSLIDMLKLKAGKVGSKFDEIELENNHFWNELIDEVIAAMDGKPSEIYDFHVGYDVQIVLEALRNPKNQEKKVKA